jgi:hypothetical protein
MKIGSYKNMEKIKKKKTSKLSKLEARVTKSFSGFKDDESFLKITVLLFLINSLLW